MTTETTEAKEFKLIEEGLKTLEVTNVYANVKYQKDARFGGGEATRHHITLVDVDDPEASMIHFMHESSKRLLRYNTQEGGTKATSAGKFFEAAFGTIEGTASFDDVDLTVLPGTYVKAFVEHTERNGKTYCNVMNFTKPTQLSEDQQAQNADRKALVFKK